MEKLIWYQSDSRSLSFLIHEFFRIFPLCGQLSNLFSQFKPFFHKAPFPQTPVPLQIASLHHYPFRANNSPVLSFEGNQVGSASLNLKSAPPDTARAVVHRGLTTDLTNSRRGTASTLTRAEVRGGGQKPYPQKKTVAPVVVPSALPFAQVECTVVVEDFGDKFEKPKTKEFIAMMNRLGLDPKKKSMFLMTEVSDNVRLSSRNIGTLKLLTPRTLNLFDILDSEKLILTKGAVEFLNERYGLDSEEDKEEDEFEEVDMLMKVNFFLI
ncbi:UNVERIFIED_CONTAM: 50S ribosomal protein L4, chloroplastic [Sesamum calycinum]|uniref:Large ribosomal subunit protein uL4c n=1 Tax=Sesamum calycinum TaxID=2727403 RepID=A0AAW2KN91_9LAMI